MAPATEWVTICRMGRSKMIIKICICLFRIEIHLVCILYFQADNGPTSVRKRGFLHKIGKYLRKN